MTASRATRLLAAAGLAVALAALVWWASDGGAGPGGDGAQRGIGSKDAPGPPSVLRAAPDSGGREGAGVERSADEAPAARGAGGVSLEGVLAAPAWVQDGATLAVAVQGVDRSGAAVRLPGAVEDDALRWRADGLPPGRYHVTASATHGDRSAWGQTTPIELAAGDGRAGLVLRLQEYALEGRVEVGDTGAPVGDFEVEVRWSFRPAGPEIRVVSGGDAEGVASAIAAWSDRMDAPLSSGSGPGTSNDAPEPAFARPRERLVAETDALGNYRVPLPGPGTCIVGGPTEEDAANRPWYGRRSSVFSVDADGPTARHVLRLRPFGHLRARVTGSDARTTATLRRAGHRGHRAHVVLPRGRLNDLELEAGRWIAFARSEDGLVARSPIDVHHRQVARPTIALVAPSTLEGLVVGPDGAPAPGVQVTARDVEVDAREHAVRSDDRGRFRIEGLAGARYVLTAALEGLRAGPVESDLPPGGAIVDAGTLALATASPDGTTGRRD